MEAEKKLNDLTTSYMKLISKLGAEISQISTQENSYQ